MAVITENATSAGFQRLSPEPGQGLTGEQASQRREAGAVNIQPQNMTPTVGRIVAKNTLTLFNIINLLLGLAVILVGQPRQTLFLGVMLSNTLMGIFQELRAKKTLDKLAILSQSTVTVVRDGINEVIRPDDIVLDDIVYLTAGNQICADAAVIQSIGLMVDESLLTGESDRIAKGEGTTVMSGSYVVGGQAYVRVTAVGQANYATRLTAEAKRSGGKPSKLLRFLRLVIRILTFVIGPLGLLLFYTTYNSGVSLEDSVVRTSAAMVGMIPEGLVLLSSVTLMVGAIRLSGRKALVQSLPGIETLARVDVLCLDKTGTITDGAMSFERMELCGGAVKRDAERAVSELMGHLRDDNATAKVLRAEFGESRFWRVTALVPFTSERKWSAVCFEEMGSYYLGAPQILLSDPEVLFQAGQYAEQGYRVLCLAHSDAGIKSGVLPKRIKCVALLLITDNIRDTARDTFAFFEREGVTLKVISGDDTRAVSAIAEKAGISNASEAVDMSRYSDKGDFADLVERYAVFGRTTPQQKRMLIRALQKNGHTACMTGDGVNDILAMREAHCSVSMIGGSDAARGVCDFVLMTSDFSAMVGVLKEGRRVINNIERVSSLYLTKTIFSLLLTIIYIFLPYAFPFEPSQMTPINALTVGIPSFFLALRMGNAKPGNKMLENVLDSALPAALTIAISVLYAQTAGELFGLKPQETSTMCVFMIGVVGYFLLLRLSKPYNRAITAMLATLCVGLILVFIFSNRPPLSWFNLESLVNRNALFCLPMVFGSHQLFTFLSNLNKQIRAMILRKREAAE